MKRLISVLLTISLLMGMLVFDVAAADESGSCGDGLTWLLSGNTLTISGTGAMYDYTAENPAPWYEAKRRIYTVLIKEGVTSIGARAFADMDNLSDVVIHKGVHSVGKGAFATEDSRGGEVWFYGKAPSFAEDAFEGRGWRIYTFPGWDDSVKQNYGGAVSWNAAKLLKRKNSKVLFGLDEQILPTDFEFVVYPSPMFDEVIEPERITIGTYDNSSYGQKTVAIIADGFEFEHLYYVTDGQNHLDLIRVRVPELPENVSYAGARAFPEVSIGSVQMQRTTDYDLTWQNINDFGDASFTITGKGIYEGYNRTFTYPILRGDIANATVSFEKNQMYEAYPVEPKITLNNTVLDEGEDYEVFYENNINVGTATARIVGKGGFYGEKRVTFNIKLPRTELKLPGTYLGEVSGELKEDYDIYEVLMVPGELRAKPDTLESSMVAMYMLYRIEGDEAVLVHEEQSKSGNSNTVRLDYDLSSVYEDAAEEGGAVYLLAYSWVERSRYVYGGAMIIGVVSKVGPATTMNMTQIEDGDFRRDYLGVSSTNGVLENVNWRSSDTSVATVEKGSVTFKRPGTVTVTAQSGNLTASKQLTMEALELTQGSIYDYSAENGARVVHDYNLLKEGTDYTLSVEQKDGQNIVTVTGCGLFKGQLVRSFDAETGEGGDHTHTYASTCETVCTGCQETRPGGHSYSNDWSKNTTHHWHPCGVCGDQADKAEHTLAAGDSSTCTVCGKLYLPGDFDGDWLVTESDVIWLLWHTVDPTSYPLVSSGDYDGDGNITESDVIHLLWHTVDPDNYPLN